MHLLVDTHALLRPMRIAKGRYGFANQRRSQINLIGCRNR
jgi:hypothetical protein